MPLNQVYVAPPTAKMSGTQDALGGKFGEALTADLHPKYFQQSINRKMWHASITTATAIPIFATNATPNFGLLNPGGSNVAAVLCRFNVGFHAGTGIAGQIGYAYLAPAGSAPAGTAAPVSTYTAGPSMKGAILGDTYNGPLIFGSAFTIGGAVSALTVHRWANMSQGAPITSTASFWNLFEDFDGHTIVPPNTLWAPVASTAIAETSMISLSFYEIPWPLS